MTALFQMCVRVGGDPRGLAEFGMLRNEVAKLSHPACPDVDWEKVQQLCLALFDKNGADLQTAAFFVLARSQRHGLDGMTEGVLLIQALVSEWSRLWPTVAPMRLEILAWLFAQLQPLLRSFEMSTRSAPALFHLGARLEGLGESLESQAHVSVVTLLALRQQVSSLLQRLERSTPASETVVALAKGAEPTLVMPFVILPASSIPRVPVSSATARKSRLALWAWAFMALVAVVSCFDWREWLSNTNSGRTPRLVSFLQQEQTIPDPVRLDSLSMFDAGSAELKPGSTKVLISALANIKAQPGWLIVIGGHTDTTGDAEQNLKLSHARATAVRDWMQRMGDISASCFAVQGFAASQPIASNDTESGRATNRRVDIRLVPQVGACG